MKGAILEKGETGYTYLKKLFLSIRHAQKDFNWLITDCQCCTQSEAFYQRIFQYDRYGWLSGEELTRMVETEDFQWIWAVLSGFPRHISLDMALPDSLAQQQDSMSPWTRYWNTTCPMLTCTPDSGPILSPSSTPWPRWKSFHGTVPAPLS